MKVPTTVAPTTTIAPTTTTATQNPEEDEICWPAELTFSKFLSFVICTTVTIFNAFVP
jgi:hypothetical protein